MELVFATNNEHKLEEINDLLSSTAIRIFSLTDINLNQEIPETGLTLEENSLQKAQFVKTKTNYNCFADDTGLEIDALNGEPGVFSARYAGDSKDPEANMQKVLEKLKKHQNRSAQFRTVISLIIGTQVHQFEGIVKGHISTQKHGVKGFGYDPIFHPEGYDQSFAEMDLELKNKISHRAVALKKLMDFLSSIR
jgi:XTP/dITP diphosphohydrolase